MDEWERVWGVGGGVNCRQIAQKIEIVTFSAKREHIFAGRCRVASLVKFSYRFMYALRC